MAKDVIRQFVAMPLGSGYSVEEQITGKPEHGGLQIIVYPMRKEHYEALLRRRGRALLHHTAAAGSRMRLCRFAEPARAMGRAAGGRMRQQIYADPYGIDAWGHSMSSRCFVTLVDAVQWRDITGEAPPTKPPTAVDYTKAGLPWFDYYAADLETLGGAQALALVKSVAEIALEKGDQVLRPDDEVNPGCKPRAFARASHASSPSDQNGNRLFQLGRCGLMTWRPLHATRKHLALAAHIRSPGNWLACFTQAVNSASSSSSSSWMSR